MMRLSSIEQALSQCLSYASNNSHGYELGYHSQSAMNTGTDCSGLVRYYAALLAGVSVDSFPDFSTRSERSVLTSRGWSAIPFSLSSAKRGDVFLTESKGHTVIYLGNSQILGAEGNWDGRHGDSSGNEVCKRNYYSYSYNWILRPPANTNGDEVEVITDSDISKIAHSVWNYYNEKVNGKDDAYQILTDIRNLLKTVPHDVWYYKNKDVNGDADTYKLLTDIHDWSENMLKTINEKSGDANEVDAK